VGMPKQGLISIVCETFNCTPDVALKQDWNLVRQILDYRLAESSKRTFNSDASKMSPEQVKMWNKLREEFFNG
tara:strand:+ start:416 stop:634 length:219 start_codon:yes stop_codon:yes gene_type:complete